MKTNRPELRLAQRLFRAKRARRRKLAALPFPEKISILLRLQQIAAEVQTATGRPRRPPWKLNRSADH